MKAHLKVILTIHGGTPRPIELGGSALVGSGRAADIRVVDPTLAAVHLRLLREGDDVFAVALAPGVLLDGRELVVDDLHACTGQTIQLGPVRMVASLWDGDPVAGRDRTESLARELVRDLLAEHPELAPELTVEAGPAAGQRFTIPPPEARVVVGRSDNATWLLFDPDLSRNHAAIDHRSDGVWVMDLESKNGTYVDGRLAPTSEPGLLMADGARIVLGDTIIRYRDPAASMLVELEGRLRVVGVQGIETRTHVGVAVPMVTPDPAPVAEAPGRRWWPAWAAVTVAIAAIALLVALIASS